MGRPDHAGNASAAALMAASTSPAVQHGALANTSPVLESVTSMYLSVVDSHHSLSTQYFRVSASTAFAILNSLVVPTDTPHSIGSSGDRARLTEVLHRMLRPMLLGEYWARGGPYPAERHGAHRSASDRAEDVAPQGSHRDDRQEPDWPASTSLRSGWSSISAGRAPSSGPQPAGRWSSWTIEATWFPYAELQVKTERAGCDRVARMCAPADLLRGAGSP